MLFRSGDRVAGTFAGFGPGTFTFLADLAANNDRDWFRDHADAYEREVRAPSIAFVTDLGNELADRGLPLRANPKHSLFRIHRDVRFSRDKSPYKTNAGAVLTRDGRKVVGISQRRTKDAARFQCTVFTEIDLGLHASLLRMPLPIGLASAVGVGDALSTVTERLVSVVRGALVGAGSGDAMTKGR